MKIFSKEITAKNLRRGKIHTRKGVLKTPFFMPDATRASVRGLTRNELENVGIYPMVVNTYHLMLQPGALFLEGVGGVHTFMNWSGPLLSDSGGYQVYSLIHKNPKLGKITEKGAYFRSVIDGSKHFLTPQKAIQIQFALGTDMMVVLDDPRPPLVSRNEHQGAVERTVRWAAQCKEEFLSQCKKRQLTEQTRPLLFAVVQGGPHEDLRRECAKELTKIGFDGYGFGGRHIDEEGKLMRKIMEETAQAIPEDAPRFALGIGTPKDIVECYDSGWDMFDCVIPTREGRHGRIFIWEPDAHDIMRQDFYNTINITNKKFETDLTPLDRSCECYACKNYSRAYLRHLFRVGEPLGPQMASLHNLQFYTNLMHKLQKYE